MAGGFFREDNNRDDTERQPFVLQDFPSKILNSLAKARVGLDVATSSAGESSDDELEEVADEHTSKDSMEKSILDMVEQNNATDHSDMSPEAIKQQVKEHEIRDSSNAVRLQSISDPAELTADIGNDNEHSKENSGTLGEETSDNITIDHEDCHITRSISQLSNDIVDNDATCISTVGSSVQESSKSREVYQQDVSPDQTISSFGTELDDLEEEINKKKRLIEQLLSNRRMSDITSSDEKQNVQIDEYSPMDERTKKNPIEEYTLNEGSLQHENYATDNSGNTNTEVSDPSAHDISSLGMSTSVDASTPNEFEGITYVSTVTLMQIIKCI